MSRETSRDTPTVAEGYERFVEENINLPIELWTMIFLYVRSTHDVRKVCKAFRKAILNPHFDKKHSMKWRLCKVLGCGVPSHCVTWDGRTSYQKYCSIHCCSGCPLISTKPNETYCDDCKYACVYPDCDKEAVKHRTYIENCPPDCESVGYCREHGCKECGEQCTEVVCNYCLEVLIMRDVTWDYS